MLKEKESDLTLKVRKKIGKKMKLKLRKHGIMQPGKIQIDQEKNRKDKNYQRQIWEKQPNMNYSPLATKCIRTKSNETAN